MEKNMHPYEIRSTMKERSLDQIAKMQVGSLYYAIERMVEQNYIEAVEVISSTNRPDKTVYRITEKGRSYFEKLLLSLLENSDPVYLPMYTALAFAKNADQAKMAAILAKRVEEVEHQVNFYYEEFTDHIGDVPRTVLHVMAGHYEHAKTELKWLKKLYEDASKGCLRDFDADGILEDE